jgi:hypothetical protein
MLQSGIQTIVLWGRQEKYFMDLGMFAAFFEAQRDPSVPINSDSLRHLPLSKGRTGRKSRCTGCRTFIFLKRQNASEICRRHGFARKILSQGGIQIPPKCGGMRIPTTGLVSLCSLSLVGMALRRLVFKDNKYINFRSAILFPCVLEMQLIDYQRG